MSKRRKTLEGRARWLRDYLKIGMETMGQRKITVPWFVISIQKNPFQEQSRGEKPLRPLTYVQLSGTHGFIVTATEFKLWISPKLSQ